MFNSMGIDDFADELVFKLYEHGYNLYFRDYHLEMDEQSINLLHALLETSYYAKIQSVLFMDLISKNTGEFYEIVYNNTHTTDAFTHILKQSGELYVGEAFNICDRLMNDRNNIMYRIHIVEKIKQNILLAKQKRKKLIVEYEQREQHIITICKDLRKIKKQTLNLHKKKHINKLLNELVFCSEYESNLSDKDYETQTLQEAEDKLENSIKNGNNKKWSIQKIVFLIKRYNDLNTVRQSIELVFPFNKYFIDAQRIITKNFIDNKLETYIYKKLKMNFEPGLIKNISSICCNDNYEDYGNELFDE